MALRTMGRNRRYDENEDEPVQKDGNRLVVITLPQLAWLERKASAFWDSPPHVFEAELRRRKAEQARC
jgi:hypothetical protein